MTKEKLNELCQIAEKREMKDDHLTRKERIQIVTAHKKLFPESKMPSNLDDAFVEIIFN